MVFEKADRIGGLLRYGIPDFKLEKWVIDRRIEQMVAEGVIFETGVEAGVDLSLSYMRRAFDSVLIATGARKPRDLDIPGRDLDGIHFAMDFLTQQNRRVAGDPLVPERSITAKDKHVVMAADFAGWPLAQAVKTHLQSKGWTVEDLTPVLEETPMYQRAGFMLGAKITEHIACCRRAEISGAFNNSYAFQRSTTHIYSIYD